ncbi:hypothetical protein LP420_25275 [Massilia sp. B-10]|nr:hypothetical protein LP420_25275 [Massilia sp. B-10]
MIDIHDPQLAQVLAKLGAGLVIHTAKPVPGPGLRRGTRGRCHAGAHYIDLADGRRFVCDFPAALDAAFRACGKTAIA